MWTAGRMPVRFRCYWTWQQRHIKVKPIFYLKDVPWYVVLPIHREHRTLHDIFIACAVLGGFPIVGRTPLGRGGSLDDVYQQYRVGALRPCGGETRGEGAVMICCEWGRASAVCFGRGNQTCHKISLGGWLSPFSSPACVNIYMCTCQDIPAYPKFGLDSLIIEISSWPLAGGVASVLYSCVCVMLLERIRDILGCCSSVIFSSQM